MTMVDQQPTLVAISHGTSSVQGQVAVAALVDAVARLRPDLAVAGGFVDVQQPDVAAVLSSLDGGEPAIIVPLLLSAGYHVHVDLQRESAASRRTIAVSAALGPDERLIDVLEERLSEVGYLPGDAVVLAAAGSSDSRAVEDCRRVGRMLAARLRTPVSVGFISAAAPRISEAIEAARREHPLARIVVSSYLIAPGYFHSLARETTADLVSEPLLVPHEPPPKALAELVLERYLIAAEGEPAP
ncbi:sirohydrochlorin chelatase [Glaciibacter superstes]|uniref:sirohydrochlorin chelatase n=1 Tax=Glaciibacter superstes TaxID=501023 RepID=UPI0003B545A0|nr:CbiX/SirB N-terminal domain-containing protein [Glaciibacter superstes]